jgi:hypothetical protein
MNLKFGTVISAALIASGTVAAAQPPQGGVKRTDLQRHDLSTKNRETVQARIDIAPGALPALGPCSTLTGGLGADHEMPHPSLE